MKIVIRDETFTGKVSQEFYLALETINISIRDLICSRIYEEVSMFNQSLSKSYSGLILLVNDKEIKDETILRQIKYYVWIVILQKNCRLSGRLACFIK
jgi:hypothetical protein